MHDTRRPSRLKQTSVVAVAAALFATAVLAVAARADPLPTITSVGLDKSNHAVVKWTKGSWQGSINVQWSTDGTLAAPNDGYGAQLADCVNGLRPNPNGDSEWLYGASCKGDDVGDSATEHVTWGAMAVGVYYFQVDVAGENHAVGGPCSFGECFTSHYSGVWTFTVSPPDDQHLGVIDAVKGKGTITHSDGTEEPAVSGISLQADDEVNTQGSPLKLTFANGSAIALDRKSGLKMGSGDLGCENCLYSFMQRKGRIWYSVYGRQLVNGKGLFSLAECASKKSRCAFVADQKKGRTWYQVYGRSVRVSNFGGTKSVVAKRGFETAVGDTTRAKPTKPRKFTPLKGKPFWKF